LHSIRFRELEELDPVAANSIHIGDTYRVARALYTIRETGKPYSSFKTEFRSADLDQLDYDFRGIFVNPPREQLYRATDYRCEAMIFTGLLQVSE
jgi:tRNA dimethylallyltransferase